MRFILTLISSLFILNLSAQKSFQESVKLMGSEFKITVNASSREKANEYINIAIKEIERIESMISSWDSESETTRVNRNAGTKPVKVSKEFFSLLERCQVISKISSGAFDITYSSMDTLWKFDGSMKRLPAKHKIASAAKKIDYRKLILNKENHTAFLKQKGMQIGFGAIGKGYAADKARKLLKAQGVSGGIINASGDMATWGKQPGGEQWSIGIKNPMNKNRIFSWFSIKEQAVVTSGDYEKFAEIDGKRYSHIIDPRTGYPATGLVSVTVFSSKAELADALATSVFVMGKEAGLNMINQMPKVECVLVDSNGKIHKSENIELKKTKP